MKFKTYKNKRKRWEGKNFPLNAKGFKGNG